MSWLERRSRLAILALFAVLSGLFTWPLLRHIHSWGIQDWDYNYFKQAAAARTMMQYGQLPLWNPWYFGGTPMLGDPESRIFYPTFPIYLASDAVRGLKLEVAIHYFIGLSGTFALARYHGASVLASITAAFIYMFSGMFAVSIGAGMTMFMVAAYVPWVFWGYLRSLERIEYAFAAAVALALMFLGGAVHFTALTGLWLAIYALWQLVVDRSRWKPVVASLAMIGLLAVGFSAVKLLPTLQLMAKYPRKAGMAGGFSAQTFAQGFVDRDLDVTAPIARWNPGGREFWTGASSGPDETGMYIGIPGLLLLVAGIALRMKSRESRLASMPLLASMVVVMWMSFGFRAPPLWSIVHKLPVFAAMRTPERLRFVFFLAFAVFAAFAVDGARSWVGRRWGNRWGTAVAIAIPALLFVDYRIVNAPALGLGASIEPLPVKPLPVFEQIAGLPLYCAGGDRLDLAERDIPGTCSWFSLYPTMLSNRGGLHSAAAIAVEHRPAAREKDARGYRGELFLEGTGGEARYLAWSPERLVIRARLDRPGLVVVNQNHDQGWRTDTGQIEAYTGLLAVRLPAGDHEIVLRYRPSAIELGLAVTAGTTILAMIWFANLRAKPRIGV